MPTAGEDRGLDDLGPGQILDAADENAQTPG